MRGVVLAGGKGTRLGELTRVTNKHLLPVGLFPMVYYPIKKLIGAGITDILLVTGVEHAGDFISLLGSGERLGCSLTYKVQEEAGGIAQALGLAEGFCGDQRCVVVLGDNIFFDSIRSMILATSFQILGSSRPSDCWIVTKEVGDPHKYGVVEYAPDGKLVGIEEKPKYPKSKSAVTGIYSYPPSVFHVIRTLEPSSRGELEITDVNNWYIKNSRISEMGLDGYWTDAGTPDSLLRANQYVTQQPPEF